MNKLLTDFNGGYPFVLDDIRFQQDAVRDALKGILSGFGWSGNELNGSYIISGLEWGSSTSIPDFTPGYVCIEGEVLYCTGGTPFSAPTPPPGSVYYAYVSSTFDTNGIKNMENGNSENAYELRTVALAHGILPSSGATPITGTTAVRLLDKIYNDLPGRQESPKFITAWGTANHWPTPYNTYVRYWKDSLGLVHIVGSVELNVAFNQSVINAFVIPDSNYFPAFESYGTYLSGADSFGTGRVTISTSGQVTVDIGLVPGVFTIPPFPAL